MSKRNTEVKNSKEERRL